MSRPALEDMYARKIWDNEHSRIADEAILAMYNLSGESGAEYESCWDKFVAVIMSEFPNISTQNLIYAEDALQRRGDHSRILFVKRIMVTLLPNSAEQIAHLGHTYRDLRQYREAAGCYSRAYDLATAEADKRNQEPDGFLRMDASSFLRYRADCECLGGLPEQALATLLEAVTIARNCNDTLLRGSLNEAQKKITTTLGWNVPPPFSE